MTNLIMLTEKMEKTHRRKPKSQKGFMRILYAFSYSVEGLKQGLNFEPAFKQEFILFFIFLGVLVFIPVSSSIKMILFLCNSLVLITELLNSAVEAVVDIAAPEYHELAKRAKDMASAAVLIALTSAGVMWLYAIFLAIYPNGVPGLI